MWVLYQIIFLSFLFQKRNLDTNSVYSLQFSLLYCVSARKRKIIIKKITCDSRMEFCPKQIYAFGGNGRYKAIPLTGVKVVDSTFECIILLPLFLLSPTHLSNKGWEGAKVFTALFCDSHLWHATSVSGSLLAFSVPPTVGF